MSLTNRYSYWYPKTVPRGVSEPHEPMGRPSNPVLPRNMEAVSIPEDLDGNWSNDSETLGVAIVYGLISMIIFIMQISFALHD